MLGSLDSFRDAFWIDAVAAAAAADFGAALLEGTGDGVVPRRLL